MTENENNVQNNTSQPGQETQNAQQKSVQDSIASVVQQYSSFKDQVAGVQKVKQPKEKKSKKSGGFSGFLVSVITLVFLFIVLCIAVSYIALPEVDKEAEEITTAIDEAETKYYNTFSSFLFVKETNSDKALNIDISDSKYFTAFEVVPKKSDDNQTEKCEINLYGANGIFSIAFCYMKAFINQYIPLE